MLTCMCTQMLSLNFVGMLSALSQIFAYGLPQNEFAALKALHESAAGHQWLWRANQSAYGVPWDVSTDAGGNYISDPCDGWQGVECSTSCFTAPSSPSCHLTHIKLGTYRLDGEIPETLTYLHMLRTLDLQSNPSLSGIIPEDIGNMTALTSLLLQNNALSGPLPPSIGQLRQLRQLNAHSNILSGSIPLEIGRLTGLLSLKLYSNHLEGPIPPALGELRQLRFMYLYNNGLTSTVPPSLGNMSSLLYFLVYNNNLHGAIPSSLGELSGLRYLYLNENELTGAVPSSIGKLSKLSYLWLHINHLSRSLPAELSNLSALYHFTANDNHLRGQLPPALCSLTALRYLYLHNNFFSGTIPWEIAKMSSLKELLLSSNRLEGTIPSTLGSLVELQKLRLHSNILTGPLPPLLPHSLEYLAADNNLLTGALPPSLSNLTRLEVLFLSLNKISGPLPPHLSQLGRLSHCYLDSNRFTGSIPASFGLLSALEYLSLGVNRLHGSMPDSLGNLSTLFYCDLSYNGLSSSLPGSLQKLTNVKYMLLNNNLSTGSIPPALLSLPSLGTLWLHVNQLSGSLPPTIELAPLLEGLIFSSNLLTGTVPSKLFQSSSLTGLHLDHNGFSHSLPSEVGDIPTLEILLLSANAFTGSLPSSLGRLESLRIMEMSSNLFSSTLPVEIGNLMRLTDVILDSNRITGSLEAFAVRLDVNTTSALKYVAVHNNQLSGQISYGLFELPSLTTLSLSVNCFSGSLPDNICANSNLEVLSMDGLAASSLCPNTFILPFSHVRLFNTLQGTVPGCLFTLERLNSLHMSGNGLTGSLVISADTPVNSSLERVVLSHNLICGSVPQLLQHGSFSILDLSYNKITGVYNHEENFDNNSQLILEVNRLSGDLSSSSLASVSTLKVLRGNLFGCASPPSGDEYHQEFTCGSTALDDAMLLWGSVLLAAAVFFFVSMKWGPMIAAISAGTTTGRDDESTETSSGPLSRLSSLMGQALYFLYFPLLLQLPQPLPQSQSYRALLRSIRFCHSLYTTLRIGIFLSIASVAALLPFYSLKFSDLWKDVAAYSTHSHTYSYILSLAYTSEVHPTVALLGGWVVVMVVYAGLYFWVKLNLSPRKEEVVGRLDSEEEEPRRNEERKMILIAADATETTTTFTLGVLGVIAINTLLVGAMNSLYVYSIYSEVESQYRIYFQMVMSLLSFLFNMLCVPFLASSIRTPEGSIRARLLMIILNSIFIPCLVTACASPSCFLGVFVEADSIAPIYSLLRCQRYDVNLEDDSYTCVELRNYDILVTPLVPPFSYKNQCSSVLLSAYIPVWFYTCALEIVSVLFLIGCMLLTRPSTVQFCSEVGRLGVLWPNHWSHQLAASEARTESTATPEVLLNAMKIVTNDVVYYAAIHLTFGLTSPLLTLAVLISFGLKLCMWMMVVGRFLCLRIGLSDPRGHSDFPWAHKSISHDNSLRLAADNAVIALGNSTLDIPPIFLSCFWPIAHTSAFFIAALCWDMAVDSSNSARSALWAPLTALGTPLLLRVVEVAFKKRERGLTGLVGQRQGKQKSTRGSAGSGLEMCEVTSSLNPLAAVATPASDE